MPGVGDRVGNHVNGLSLLGKDLQDGTSLHRFHCCEIPVAFPIRPELSAGFSYWIYQGESQGVTLQASKDEFSQDVGCDVHYSAAEYEGDDLPQITVKNMSFPAMIFAVCAVISAVLQMVHRRNVKNGRESRSLIGRESDLTKSRPRIIMEDNDDKESESDDSEPKNCHRAIDPLQRRPRGLESTFLDSFGENNDGGTSEESPSREVTFAVAGE